VTRFLLVLSTGVAALGASEVGSTGTDHRLVLVLGILLTAVAAFILLALFIRRQQRHLAESRAHYHTLMDMAEGYFAFRVLLIADGFRPELASPSIAAILGHPIEKYQRDPELFLTQMPYFERKGLAAAVRKTLLLGRPLQLTLAIRHGTSGARCRIMIHARASRTERGLVADGICLDLSAEAHAESERRRMERHLQQALRHESLALLAGGVAHDFNNLLGAIRGNAELLKPAILAEPVMLGRWNRLVMAVDRAAGLARQILSYTGKAAMEAKPLDVEREIRQLAALLKHSLPAQVHIRQAIEPNLNPVLFDQVQFQQVILNLLINAAESYGGKPGVVTISAIRGSGHQLILRVSDLGCGMDIATQARMFEPYFTTKQHGHGLGLASVRGIVDKAGGTMTCHSTLGKGSTFSLLLESLPGQTIVENALPSQTQKSINKNILVVDDDLLMRETVSAILTDVGYHVASADSGQTCLQQLEKANTFDALLLDYSMPITDGLAVLRRLRAAGNTIPVLMMSGYQQDPDLGPLLTHSHTRFIAKPFTGAQLTEELQSFFSCVAVDDESSSSIAIQKKTPFHNWRS